MNENDGMNENENVNENDGVNVNDNDSYYQMIMIIIYLGWDWGLQSGDYCSMFLVENQEQNKK